MNIAAEITIPPRAGATSKSVLERVRRMIVTGDFVPGEQVRQEETAEILGVSRVPLREAMNVLADDGVVRHEPSRGYFIAKRKTSEIAQIRRMMHALERELLKTLPSPDAAILKQLRELNRNMRTTIGTSPCGRLAGLSHDFHLAIYTISPDDLIAAALRRLWPAAAPSLILQSTEGRARAVAGQEAIIATLAARDGAAPRRVVKHPGTLNMWIP